MTILWVICLLVNLSQTQVSGEAHGIDARNVALSTILNSVLNDDGSPCDRVGVVCDEQESIWAVDWADRNLSGILDDHWTSLKELTSLDLSGNGIKGTLPPSWASLENLVTLNLANNSIGGSLPPEWSSLKKLVSLDLRGNNMSLDIPNEWDLLPLFHQLFEVRLGGRATQKEGGGKGRPALQQSIFDLAAPQSRNLLDASPPPPSAGATIVFFSDPSPPPPSQPPPPPPSPSPFEASYIWVASEWIECSVTCGGGIQTRSVVCVKIFENRGVAVDDGFCETDKADTERSCNTTPCSHYSYEVGAWSVCSSNCGWGWQARSVHCREVDSRVIVGARNCQGVKPADMRECFGGVCPPYRWKHGNWPPCNATCEGGIARRSAECHELETGAVVPSNFCGAIGVLERTCNTSPCKTHRWQVGLWSECSKRCDGGTRARSVVCVDGTGVTEDALCGGQKPTSSMLCNTRPCEPEECDCRPPSLCIQGKCQCLLGYSGSKCEIPPRCGVGVADKEGECCQSGVLEVTRQCCELGSRQGKDGTCCLEERLDVCGECNGLAKAVDITGMCCAGLIDEGGICCESQIIDECGICDGDGTACGISLTLDMTIPVLVGLDDPSSAEFQELAFNITSAISSNTDMPQESLRVRKIENPPAKRRRLHQESSEIQLEVVPPWTLALPEPEGRLTGDYLVGEFDKVTGYASNRMSFNGVGSTYPKRVALCGNGVCETGERPTSENWSAPENNNACFPDCPFVWKECPGSPQCSGHGKCLPGDGLCECFAGYMGDSCDECSGRYVKEGDLCVTEKFEWAGLPTTLSRNPYTAPPTPSVSPHTEDDSQDPDSPAKSLEKDDTHITLAKIIGGGVGVTILLVAIAMAIRVHRKRRRRKTHNHNVEEELDIVGRMRSLDRVRFKRRMQRMQEKQKQDDVKERGKYTLETSLSGKAFDGRMDPFHRYLQDPT